MNIPQILLHTHHTPCGNLTLGSYDGRLCLCDWELSRHPGAALARIASGLRAEWKFQQSDVTTAAASQLDEYFAYKRKVFDMPLLFIGTPFQTSVWHKLMEIPYGHTISYGTLAAQLGRPSAVRAVANANGANAISIFSPCHRVIGSDGSLTGYGGGLEVKRRLLLHETSHY